MYLLTYLLTYNIQSSTVAMAVSHSAVQNINFCESTKFNPLLSNWKNTLDGPKPFTADLYEVGHISSRTAAVSMNE